MAVSPNQAGPNRTLSRREAELVSWLEVERPKSVSLAEIASALDWPQKRTYNVASRLAKKSWLHRTRAGHYEPLLGESAGILVPDPWVALTSWKVPYYVALASAAYEHNLIPDRPGAVQVCVSVGTAEPSGWKELAITLVPRRAFQLDGSQLTEAHGVAVRLAGIERVLLDGATMPGRVGGVFGLARIVNRGAEQADWRRFVHWRRRPAGEWRRPAGSRLCLRSSAKMYPRLWPNLHAQGRAARRSTSVVFAPKGAAERYCLAGGCSSTSVPRPCVRR